MTRPSFRHLGIPCALLVALSASTPARIKLVALPDRAAISLSIEHPTENLVQEERVLTLQRGVNQIDFSWQGVSIDVSAIVLEALENPGEVRLIAIRYPPGENALVWDVYAPRAMTERVRVSYLLGGIGREVAYRAVADRDERNLRLQQHLRLRNDSGERFERIRIFSGIGDPYVTDLDAGEMRQTQVRAVTIPFERAFIWDAATRPHDPSKELTNVGLPIQYIIENTVARSLGTVSLPRGKVRIHQDDGRGGVAFIGEDWGTHTPVTERLRLAVGESRDLTVTRKKIAENRTRERRNNDNQVVLHDLEEEYEFTIRNFRSTAAAVTILDHFDRTWSVKTSTHPYTRENSRTMKYEITVPASDSVVVRTTIARRNLFDLRRFQ